MGYRFWAWITVACAIVIGLMLTVVGDAEATENTCDYYVGEPKVEVTGSHTEIDVTAPEGFRIVGYCVKAGSAKHGDGPVEVALAPGATAVTITHPSGKDISHYVVRLTPVDALVCPEGYVPGWLDENGFPQGCVNNGPGPSITPSPEPSTPETPDHSNPPVIPESSKPVPVVATPTFTG